MITDPREARAWLEQWRSAAPALAEIRRLELLQLSDSESRLATDALLEIAAAQPFPASRVESSAMVELQESLHRAVRR